MLSPKLNFPPLPSGWLALPGERSVAFLPVFGRMSVAIQSVLREHVPVEYFNDPEKYRDLRTAGPMLVYQASIPFRGKKRAELTYDVLNPALIAMLFRRAEPKLTQLIEGVESPLRTQGMDEIAGQYTPKRAAAIVNSVKKLSKSRRYLFVLIRAESVLVDALVQLSGLGDLPRKAQAKKWSSFGKKWNFQLRRLCPGRDFTRLVPVLLAAVEEALHDGGAGLPGIDTGVLRTASFQCPELG